MKKKSPMQAMKGGPKKGSMEAYAAKRNTELKKVEKPLNIEVIRPMMMHDPEADLHTLTRAAEIKGDKKRHGAVKKAAMRKHKMMASIMGKDKA